MNSKAIRMRILAFTVAVLVFVACAGTASANRPNRPNASSYEDYLEVIKELDVPDFYVRFEHIQVLGDFEFYAGEYSDYYAYYSFIDKNGYEGSLNVYQKSFLEDKITYLVMPDNLSDMRNLNSEESGAILRGPLRYQYSRGRLICIYWVAGDVEFSLGGGGMLDDYPMNGEETIYSRLLSTNKETVLDAYKELMRDIPLQPGESIFNRAPYRTIAISSVILLGICAAVAYAWMTNRRRRTRHEV